MRSTVDKTETLRTAMAQAVLRTTPRVIATLESRTSPKGDALEIARAAGIMAAKRTWELIPYCHPIPIDQIAIDYALGNTDVTITARAVAVAKTGVEMEALVAAQFAATTLFDMLKPLGDAMEIGAIKILEKTGGKSNLRLELPPDFRAAIVVTSDSVSAGKNTDRTGRLIHERLVAFGITVCDSLLLPDDREKIRNALLDCCERGIALVITTGGTGVGPRDVTVEATRDVIERELPGVSEAARNFGQRRTPFAMLSRGIAGVRGRTLIVNLPGSTTAVKESLDAIFPALLHTIPMMAGGGHGK